MATTLQEQQPRLLLHSPDVQLKGRESSCLLVKVTNAAKAK